MRFFIAAVLVAGACAQDNTGSGFSCPDLYGDFADEVNCDYFWRCEKGVATPKECMDGHAFNPNLRGQIYPCDYKFKVDCAGREELQPAQQGTDEPCLRQNGVFPHATNCGAYYTCEAGLATPFECATGLHLSLTTMECVWPEMANRENCDTPIREGDFTCPEGAGTEFDHLGNLLVNPTYLHPTDCRAYYVCLKGIRPQLLGCPEGTVYNDATGKCADPEQVSGCENYYEA